MHGRFQHQLTVVSLKGHFTVSLTWQYQGDLRLCISFLGIIHLGPSLRKIVQARCPRLVKFGPGKSNFRIKSLTGLVQIVESKLKKHWTKQTRIPFFKSKQGHILLIRDTNGCPLLKTSLANWSYQNFQTAHARAKISSGLCNFYRASKICLLPALWACDLKNFFWRLWSQSKIVR